MFENDWSTMIFLHESFHVYEYRASKVRLGGLTMLLKRLRNKDYSYEIEPGKDFWDYGLEQRATIIMERWYLGTTGRRTGYGGSTVTMQELNQVIPFTCVVCQ